MDKKRQEQVVAALSVLRPLGSPFEIRVLKTKKGVKPGYFDHIEAVHKAIMPLDGQVPGISVTLNSINPDLRARANNKIKPFAKNTTADGDVTRRRCQKEKDAAHSAVVECRDLLSAFGWPEPIFCDSGNGNHLLYRIDLPNGPASRELIERCLQAVAFQIDTEQVVVDQAMGNAPRLIKVYGTMFCKGDSTPDRPNRRAEILATPSACEMLMREKAKPVTQHRTGSPDFTSHDFSRLRGTSLPTTGHRAA